ncbi:hypothetical protein ACHAXR_003132, partial [Thalassiosira sp. AJA248-18]
DFDFYDLVWYWPHSHPSTAERSKELARWVGVAHRIGSDMCYWLIPVLGTGTPIADTTVQHVTAEDLRNPDIKRQVDTFNERLEDRLNDDNFHLPANDHDFYLDDMYMTQPTGTQYETPEDRPEADDVESYDKFIGATFLLDPNKNKNDVNIGTRAKAVKHATDYQGNPIGRAHNNRLLDTREYEVELQDGTIDRYFANIIAENLWSQCDTEGHQFTVFREIIDHRKNARAIPISNGFKIGSNGQRKPKKTTVGWDILVEFNDGSSDWVPLKEVKESNPIELAEYAFANRLQEEPAFKWWAVFVLRKRNRIIIREALQFDRENGNDLWEKAIKKEMGKACVAYEVVDGCDPNQAGTNNEP